jgi:hypothetical protein
VARRFVKQSNGGPKVLRESDRVNADVTSDILRHQRGDGSEIGGGFFSGGTFENFSAMLSKG